jgi:hypothetical protein
MTKDEAEKKEPTMPKEDERKNPVDPDAHNPERQWHELSDKDKIWRLRYLIIQLISEPGLCHLISQKNLDDIARML